MRLLHYTLFIIHSTLAACALCAQAAQTPITPLPAQVIISDSDAGKRVSLTNHHVIVCADANLATLYSDTIHKWTTLRLPIRPAKSGVSTPAITITLDPAPAVPEACHPEGYALTISESGNIDILASTTTGAFYALQTLTHLLAASPSAPPLARQRPIATERSDILPNRESKIENSIALPILSIHDSPRFAWRGLHLDESRHFFGMAAVKQLLDTMALFKFNTFHWHLTDDQGWRIEIKKYPELTQAGAWRTDSLRPGGGARRAVVGIPYGGYYTQDQIREIVAYARQRHITIVPEIEMPAHSRAALAAYPQYGNTDIQGYARVNWRSTTPTTYAPKEETFAFLFDVLDEVCELFPGEYIHIGGDEAPKGPWETSPFAQSVMARNNLKDADELQAWFLRRIEKHLASRGRKIIGWDEIQEGGLSPTAVMMVWRDWKWALHALEKGNKIILTPSSHCYFDFTPGNVPATDPYYEHTTLYATRPRSITLEKVYHFEPVSEGIRPEHEAQILGCQANLWTEYMWDWPKAQYFYFPRALALSEVAWRPRGARDWPGFQTRLPAALRLLDQLGVNYQPLSAALAAENPGSR